MNGLSFCDICESHLHGKGMTIDLGGSEIEPRPSLMHGHQVSHVSGPFSRGPTPRLLPQPIAAQISNHSPGQSQRKLETLLSLPSVTGSLEGQSWIRLARTAMLHAIGAQYMHIASEGCRGQAALAWPHRQSKALRPRHCPQLFPAAFSSDTRTSTN